MQQRTGGMLVNELFDHRAIPQLQRRGLRYNAVMNSQFELRPRNMGELLDEAFRLYRGNFWTLLGIVAIVQLPVVIIASLLAASLLQSMVGILDDPLGAATSPVPFWQSSVSNINTLVSGMVVQFANSALCIAVASAVFGRKVTFRQAYKHAFSRWQSILGLAFISAVVVGALTLGTLFALLSVIGWIGGLGALMFYSLVINSLLMPVLILEETSAWDTIGRAWRLVRQHWWRAVGFTLLLWLLVYLIQVGPAALLGGVLGYLLIDSSTSPQTFSDSITTGMVAGTAVGVVGTTLMTLVATPFSLTAMTLFYLDLRVRDEGFDLLVELADAESDPLQLLASAPKALPEGNAIRRQDVGRAFGLAFAFMGIFFGIVAVLTGFIAAVAGVAALSF